jgi:glycosidase
MLSLLLATALAAEPAALMFVLVDRFADGRADAPGSVSPDDPQGWHGGDLQGVLDHLDEIVGDGLWLSPIQQTRTEPVGPWGAFHGYWTTDLHRLEPRLATEAELVALSDGLRAEGKELWLDLVTNHVGYDAPLLAEHPDWFHHHGDIVDWSDPVQVVTHDVHGLPDLDQDHPDAYAWLLEGASRWVRLARPTGFRVDAVKHVPEGFLARLRDDLRELDPELQLMGEVFDGDPFALAARQRADRLDRVFDFPLHYALKDAVCDNDPGRLAGVIALDGVYDDPSSLVPFLDNHDVARIRSVCHDDLDAVARALALLLTSRGTPMITWGTAAGLQGAEEPDNRADMVFEPQPLRPAIDALLALRRAHPALGRRAATRVLWVDPQTVVLGRRADDEQAMIVLTTDRAHRIAPPSDARAWVVQGVEGPVEGGGGELLVPAGAVGIVVGPDLGLAEVFEGSQPLRTVRLPVPEGHVLVGASERLGRWDPARGHPSVEGWVSLEVPRGEVLEYKLVGRRSDGSWDWPDTGNTVQRVP